MGCSCPCDEYYKIENNNNYYECFDKLKKMNQNVINNINIQDDIYLIDVKSIPLYYEIIKNYLEKQQLNKEEEKKLKIELNRYRKEPKIKDMIVFKNV